MTRVWYRRNNSPSDTMRSLFRRSLFVYQQHASASDSSALMPVLSGYQSELCSEACRSDQRGKQPSSFLSLTGHMPPQHAGAMCCVENASPDGIVAQFGKDNTVHWMVPPGLHIYRSEVTRQLNLPFDTTAHYVTGHLHPFGRSLKLIEMDSGQTVFDIRVGSMADRLGMESVSEISTRTGEPIYTDRRYELVAEYENTTDRPIDAMAILYLYAAEEPRLTASSTPAK